MLHRLLRTRSRQPVVLSLCVLASGSLLGCAEPPDPEAGFGTYVGSAVEGPGASDDGGMGGAINGATTGTSTGTSTTGGFDPNTTGGTDNTSNTTGGGDNTTATTGGGDTSNTTGGVDAAAGTLSFSVLTQPIGGRYAPRNIGAIWVETASGAWVKTLAVWARSREQYLKRFAGAAKGNRVDAVSGATLSSHQTHSVSWDSTDQNGQIVADGDYRVVVELTDQNGPGDSAVIPFTKGPSPVTMSPADTSHFVTMSLSYQ